MRGVSLVAIALLAGCTQLSAGPSEEKRREYDARIVRELEEGTARRARQLHANRGVLDRLGPFPGAELLSEEHQGNDDTDLDVSDDALE